MKTLTVPMIVPKGRFGTPFDQWRPKYVEDLSVDYVAFNHDYENDTVQITVSDADAEELLQKEGVWQPEH